MAKIIRQPGPPLPGRDSGLSPGLAKSLKRSEAQSRALGKRLKKPPSQATRSSSGG